MDNLERTSVEAIEAQIVEWLNAQTPESLKPDPQRVEACIAELFGLPPKRSPISDHFA
jgi:hypothetical protein